MKKPSSQHALVLLLLAVGLLYLFSFRQGHIWNCDFAQYLQHAQQLAAGEPYALSGVAVSRLIVPPPYPAAYPPVFPAVLVPLLALFGPDLEILKLLNLIFFIPALYLMARLFSPRLEPASLLAVLALVALNPNCWQMKDSVLSDIPFIFFTYAALLAVRRSAEAEKGTWWGRYGFLAAGTMAYLSFATRTAGIVILPAAVLVDLLRTRRVSGANLRAALVAASMAVAQFLLLPGGPGYRTWIGEADWQVYLFNLRIRLHNFVWLWGVENPSMLATAVAAVAGLAVLFLFLRRLLGKPDLIDLFFGLYLLILLIYPGGSLRYLVPVLPILLLYLFEGIDRLYTGGRIRLVARTALIIALLLFYASGYARLDLRSIPDGVTGPEARAVFDHIREQTAEDDVIVCMLPRVIHFYTGRTAAPYFRPFEDWLRCQEIVRGERRALSAADQDWRLEAMREVGAGFLLQSDFWSFDRLLLSELLARHPERFSLVRQTAHFRLYRINWPE